MGLELEGEISSQTIPSLIQPISQSGETGVFHVSDGRREKTVYFLEGRAIFATSDDPEDRLGVLFLRKGLLSLENLINAVDVSLRTHKRLGTVLVEFEFIRPRDLVEGVIEQVKEILLSIFNIHYGSYRFQMGPLPTQEMVTLQISTGNVIMDGIQRIANWQRIWKATGGLDATYENTDRLEELSKDISMTLEQWTLLSHLDRKLTLREICRVSPLKDLNVCRFLWAFNLMGIIRKTT